jgi:hypothetical protein
MDIPYLEISKSLQHYPSVSKADLHRGADQFYSFFSFIIDTFWGTDFCWTGMERRSYCIIIIFHIYIQSNAP